MNRGVRCAVSALLMFGSLGSEIAAAADVAENNESGLYLAIAASRVEHDPPKSPLVNPPPGDLLRAAGSAIDHKGYSAGVGYRFNRFLAAEAAYMHLGDFSVGERWLAGRLSYGVRVRGPSVSVLGSLPLGEQFTLFVRGGVLSAEQRVSHYYGVRASTARQFPDVEYRDETIFAGVGATWSFAPKVQARLEYQRMGDLQYDTANAPGPSTVGRNREVHENSIDQVSLGIVIKL